MLLLNAQPYFKMLLLLVAVASLIFACNGSVANISSLEVTDSFEKFVNTRDNALFIVNGNNVTLRGVSSDCYECDWNKNGKQHGSYISAVVDTTHPWNYIVIKNQSLKEYIKCLGSYQFEEHGTYMMDVNENSCSPIKVVKRPSFTYLPLIVLLAVLVFLVIIYKVGIFVWRYYTKPSRPGYLSMEDNENCENKNPAHLGSMVDSLSKPVQRNRIKSIDTFRGISLTVMIFVNYDGGGYWFFSHSAWNGLTVADLLFPWFIFIMGSSIYISCHSLQKKLPKRKISQKIFVRAAKLLILGLFLNNGSDLANWRFPGVLQRFAISYLVVALVFIWLSPAKEELQPNSSYWKDVFRDVWFPLQHLFMLFLLTVYLLIIYLVTEPGCPRGYFGPGGNSDHGAYRHCTGGASGYIDRSLFGINHIYGNPTCKDLYKCIAYDPEGLLGTIPSILLTYLGLQAARVLFLNKDKKSHIVRWFIWSVVLGVLAIGLCGGTANGGPIPINKNLWSLSFIFAMGSTAFILLMVCYVLVDVKQIWSGAPFYYADFLLISTLGMNSILLYCCHEIFEDYFPFNFKNNDSHAQLTIRSAVGCAVWLLVSYICYVQKIFLKL